MGSVIVSVVCGVIGYVIGSIPFGWIIVKLVKGTDIRQFGSGRTGGTNVFRVAGAPAGITTAVLDVLKGVLAVILVRQYVPGTVGWAEALAGVGVVFGHNASLFLGFRGGAGGATAVGTGIALWPMAGVPALLLGSFVLFVIGYASVATIVAGLAIALTMSVGAIFGFVPLAYAAFGWGTLALVLIALRPNLKRLREGTERRVSWFGHRNRVANSVVSSHTRGHD